MMQIIDRFWGMRQKFQTRVSGTWLYTMCRYSAARTLPTVCVLIFFFEREAGRCSITTATTLLREAWYQSTTLGSIGFLDRALLKLTRGRLPR